LSVLRTMFHTKTLASRADHDFLPIAPAQVAREPKQRRMMAIALALLIVALGFVLYMDRDFWFPDTQEAEDQLEPVPAMTAATQPATKPAVELPTGVSRPPIVAKKNHASKSQVHVKSAAPAVSSKTVTAAGTTTAAAVAPNVAVPASAAPLNATTTRTVLPPLEVEVVAGDNHRTVRPGTNSVHVDLQPGSAPRPVANPPATRPETASAVTTNAAERVQMSAGAAEVVSQPVKPGYPMLARQMRVQGSVILQALIGRDGTIQDLHVLSGPAILADAAQDAVRQWRFKPHYVGSDAVETQAKITVNFTISTN
jgi:periplasmic protein TonB